MQIPDPRVYTTRGSLVARRRLQAGGPSLSDVVLTKGTSDDRRLGRETALSGSTRVLQVGDG